MRVEPVAEFRLVFEQFLPKSFDEIISYVRSKYHEGPSLPRHRSPSQRHPLVVMAMFLSDGFPRMRGRLEEANKRYLKNEFIAALAIPFDHVAGMDEAREKLRLFLTDCENLSELQFEMLLRYLTPSVLLDDVRWWLLHSLTPILLKSLAVVAGAAFFLQGILGFRIISGSHHCRVFDFAFTLTNFQAAMTGLLTFLVGLSLATGNARKLISLLLVIVIFPVYLVGASIGWFFTVLLKKISALPYETVLFEPSFHLRSRVGRLSSLVAGSVLACFSLLNIGLFAGTAWAQLNTSLAFVSLLILLAWFYFWNFQPLLFVESGVRVFVWLSTFRVSSKEGMMRDGPIKPGDANVNARALERVQLYLERMDELTQGNRFNVFAVNCFILLMLTFITLIVVEYSAIYWGLYVSHGSWFQPLGPTLGMLHYRDFLVLSLNNLPIGGTLNLRGTNVAIELLLFSQRFLAVSLLVVAVFAYSSLSHDQIETGKETLRKTLRSYQGRIDQKMKVYEDLSKPGPDEKGSGGTERSTGKGAASDEQKENISESG